MITVTVRNRGSLEVIKFGTFALSHRPRGFKNTDNPANSSDLLKTDAVKHKLILQKSNSDGLGGGSLQHP